MLARSLRKSYENRSERASRSSRATVRFRQSLFSSIRASKWVLWPLLGALGALLGALGALLAALGALLGALGALLGRSWPLLGPSWVLLGRSWAALGTTCKKHQKIDAKDDRFGPPKASQNDSKIDPQIDQKSMQSTMRKKTRYRTNIGPSQDAKVIENQ